MSKKRTNLNADFKYTISGQIVPSKSLGYKKDKISGKIKEIIKPRTHDFENKLNSKLKGLLKSTSLFPTKKEVFIIITHGLKSKNEYGKCDLDNRAKTILDALKKVIYFDDSQVQALWTNKEYLKIKQDNYCQISVKILSRDFKQKLQDISSKFS